MDVLINVSFSDLNATFPVKNAIETALGSAEVRRNDEGDLFTNCHSFLKMPK